MDCSLAGAFLSGRTAACKKENLVKSVYNTSDHSIRHIVSTVTSTENIFQALSALLLVDPFVLIRVMQDAWEKRRKRRENNNSEEY